MPGPYRRKALQQFLENAEAEIKLRIDMANTVKNMAREAIIRAATPDGLPLYKKRSERTGSEWSLRIQLPKAYERASNNPAPRPVQPDSCISNTGIGLKVRIATPGPCPDGG